MPIEDNIIPRRIPGGGLLDSRIFKTNKNNYAISYNFYINEKKINPHSRNTRTSPIVKKSKLLFAIAYSNLIINPKMNICMITDRTLPCFNLTILTNNKMIYPLSKRLSPSIPFFYEEKNWVFWNGKISYWFEPHIVMDMNDDSSCKKVIHTSSKKFVVKLKEMYPSLRFSLGAPPIIFNRTEYIGVGHSVYNINRTTILPPEFIRSKLIHRNVSSTYAISNEKNPRLVYMMYFYTFERKPPYKITRISHSFIPEHNSQFTLVFPSGITKYGKDYMVSYGEGDKFCKFLTITSKKLNSILIPYNEKAVKKYKFLTFLN